MEIEQADQKEKNKEVQVDNQGQRSSDIREVIISKELVPFVGSLDSMSQEKKYNWPDEDVLLEVAAALDRETREEEVARARRPFWAEEVLLAVQGLTYGRGSRGGADPSSERS